MRALSDMPSAPILWRNQQGDSALTWAVWYGHEAIVEDLLAAGATVEGNAFVAAGAVVEAGTTVPAKEMWAGQPAKKLLLLHAYGFDNLFTNQEDAGFVDTLAAANLTTPRRPWGLCVKAATVRRPYT